MRQNEMIIPEWLFKEHQAPVKNKVKKVYNHKILKQIARENFKLKDKELDKEVAKEMNNPYYFTDENLKIVFKKNLNSHNVEHAKSLLTIEPNFPEFENEFRYINKIIKDLSVIYARLINQYKFKYHKTFSPSFYKNKEDSQRSDETELFNNLIINHNLTETDIDNNDVKSQLEHQNQTQVTRNKGEWMDF